MQFRWIAAVALWTMLAGPIFAPSYPAGDDNRRLAAPGATHRPALRWPARR